MKYKKSIIDFSTEPAEIITISMDDNLISFPAELGNPNYDAFLTSAKLTDEEVHALEPDVWYDFPTEETN